MPIINPCIKFVNQIDGTIVYEIPALNWALEISSGQWFNYNGDPAELEPEYRMVTVEEVAEKLMAIKYNENWTWTIIDKSERPPSE